MYIYTQMVHVSSHHWHQCPAYLGILNDFLKYISMSKFIIWRVTENIMCACVYLLIFGFPRMLGGPSFVVINETWSEAWDSKPARVEVICRSYQARGFSEQVSNRIAVPQRKSILDLYEQKWNTFREWCLLNGINPHTPTVPMIADFLLHLFRDKQLATITFKGYRSALSSLMASRGMDISHDPDLNALMRSFSIERLRIVRETPRWDLALVQRFL